MSSELNEIADALIARADEMETGAIQRNRERPQCLNQERQSLSMAPATRCEGWLAHASSAWKASRWAGAGVAMSAPNPYGDPHRDKTTCGISHD